MKLTAGSLFSGIGGLDLAASIAGFDIQFHVEIDEFCRKVLNKHAARYWPNAETFTDVRAIGSHNLPKVDCLFGGFPCQDISVAGKQIGFAGSRSSLWYEFKRVIGEIRPSVVLLENVPGIYSRPKKICKRFPAGGTVGITSARTVKVTSAPPPLFQVITGLAEMGYVGRYGTISAADAGAPHQRERWFLVAYTDSIGRGQGFDHWQERHLLHHVNGDAAQSEPEWQGWQRGARAVGEIMANPIGNGNGDIGAGHILHHRNGNGSQEESRRIIQQLRTVSSGASLGNPNSTGQQKPIQARQWTHSKKNRARLDYRLGRSSYSGWQRWQTQSRFRGTPDGLPRRVDFPGWPARPGEDQYAYEPSRVTSTKTPDRAARLKALGNAVVPEQAYPLFVAVHEWLTALDADKVA